MRAAGVNPGAIASFERYWDQLAQGSTGLIREATIRPLTDPDRLEEMTETDQDRHALAATAIIKLNGGLGTSMGLNQAKVLLTARDGRSFLDIIVEQVLASRRRHQVRLPLIFMNSFNTRRDTLEALRAYPGLPVEGLPLDIMQSEEPKLLAGDLSPVEWPANQALEWCPPGHGDLYPALWDSGLLDALISQGFRYASVSNSDNLGAAPSAVLAGWFARTGAGFATEITPRTVMDVKGGHVAVRISDGRFILREAAQTHPDDMACFTDPAIHRFVHCNNLWLDLVQVRAKLAASGAVLHLPLIRNAKTVDPTDPGSPGVIQIESAMGAAIESFDNAVAVAVPRSRFLPVKRTNELALLRSDVFEMGDDHTLGATVSPLPVVELSQAYTSIAGFEERMAYPLSLREATRLTVRGDWRFGHRVRVRGDVSLDETGGVVPDGTDLFPG